MIYIINKEELNPNTLIHEYTHIWSNAVQQKNPKLWNNIKDLLNSDKTANALKDILGNVNEYKKLGEDAMASEILSRLSGQKNREKLEQKLKESKGENKTLLEKINSLLKEFWKWVSKNILDIQQFDSIDDITDRVLYDLISGTNILEKTSNTNKETTIQYTPKGKQKQTYIIKGSHIYNKDGKEVFKGNSVDRNKIFANLAIQQGRAIIVEHNGNQYVVNNKEQIISVTTGKIMQWGHENGDRNLILKYAKSRFNSLTNTQTTNLTTESQPSVEQQVFNDTDYKAIIDRKVYLDENSIDYKLHKWKQVDTISQSDKRRLSESVMQNISIFISAFVTSPEIIANYDLIGNAEEREKVIKDIKENKYSRKDVINKLGFNNIVNIVKNGILNNTTVNREEIEKNWDAILYNGNGILYAIEGFKINKLKQLELVQDQIYDLDSKHNNEDQETELESWQIDNDQRSAIDSLTEEIRTIIYTIPIYQNGKPLKNEWGLTRFESGFDIAKFILKNCSSRRDYESFKNALMAKKDVYKWIEPLLDVFDTTPNLRQKVFRNFRKAFNKRAIFAYDQDTKQLKPIILNYDSDVTSVKMKNFENVWNNNINSKYVSSISKGNEISKYSTADKQSAIQKDKDNIERILNQNYVTFSNSYTVKDIAKNLGFNIDGDIIDNILKNDFIKNNFLKNLNSILVVLENIENAIVNPLSTNINSLNITGYVRNIFDIIKAYEPSYQEDSIIEKNKNYYAYIYPSFFTDLIDLLKNEDNFDEQQYQQVIREIYNDDYLIDRETGEFRNEILKSLLDEKNDLRSVFDSISILNDQKKEILDMGRFERFECQMSAFKNKIGRNGSYSRYICGVFSNKEQMQFVTLRNYTYNEIRDKYYNILLQEIDRIRDVISRARNKELVRVDNYDISSNDLKNVKNIKKPLTADDFNAIRKSGGVFKHLSFLNEALFDENSSFGNALRRAINDNDRLGLEDSFVEEFGRIEDNDSNSLFVKYFNSEYEAVKDLIKNDENNQPIYDEKEVKEFIFNDFFAQIQLSQLLQIDTAYNKNAGDSQKRAAAFIAPGLKLDVNATFIDQTTKKEVRFADEKATMRTVVIQAQKVIADSINVLEKIFDEKIAQFSLSKNKQEFEMFKNVLKTRLLDTYSKFDAADAQSWMSPTGFWKKLGMQGENTQEVQNIINEIANGNLNIDYLRSVLGEPQKPVVYGFQHMNYNTTNGGLFTNKCLPTYIKDSEITLLLADAIIRGNKQNSILTGLFDLMEDSHYSEIKKVNGKTIRSGYKQNGIDNITMSSAVKLGLQGTIDLSQSNIDDYKSKNNCSTAEAVKGIIRSKIYKKDGSYDNRYVIETSFNDYRIQQEVPPHLRNHKQQEGSQKRVLDIVDIDANSTFRLKDLNGIYKDYKGIELQKEYLHLASEYFRLATDELLEEFGVDKTIAERKMILSEILKKQIESDSRYDRELLYAVSINPITGDFNVPLSDPINFFRIEQLINSIVKKGLNKQMISGGPIVQASSYGFDKKLSVRFKYQDESGVWRLLQPFSEFNDSIDEYKEYIKDKNAVLMHHEILITPPWGKNINSKLIITEDNIGDLDNDRTRIGSYMTPTEAIRLKIITEEMLYAIGNRIPTENKSSIYPMKIVGFVPEISGTCIMLPEEIVAITGSDFDIDKTFVRFKHFKGKYEYKYDRNNLTKEGINNRLFDINMAIYSHPSMQFLMFNPQGFDNTKKAGKIALIGSSDVFKVNKKTKEKKYYELKELEKMSIKQIEKIIEDNDLSNDNKNIHSLSTQLEFFEKNIEGAQLLGMFANNNTAHAFCQLHNQMRESNSMDKMYVVTEKSIKLDGIIFDRKTNLIVDDILNRNKDYYISSATGEFVGAAADVAKDDVLGDFNANRKTIDLIELLIRCGFDHEFVGLFINQPIIKQAIKNDDFENGLENAIDEIKKRGYKLSNENPYSFKKEDLFSHLNKNKYKDNLNEYYEYQYFIAETARILLKPANDLLTLSLECRYNSIKNGCGPTILDNFISRERHEDFVSNPNNSIEGSRYIVEDNELLNILYQNQFGKNSIVERILRDDIVEYSQGFQELYNLWGKKAKYNTDEFFKLFNDWNLYRLTVTNKNLKPFVTSTEEQRKKWYEFPKVFKEIQSIAQKENINNLYLKLLYVDEAGNLCINSKKIKGEKLDILKSDIESLVYSKNDKLAQFTIDSFYYFLFKNGFDFSPYGDLQMFPVTLKTQLGLYDYTSKPNLNSENQQQNFLIQFYRNHPEFCLPFKIGDKELFIKNSKFPYNRKSVKIDDNTYDAIEIYPNRKDGKYHDLMKSFFITEFEQLPNGDIDFTDNVYMLYQNGDSKVFIKLPRLGNSYLKEYEGDNDGITVKPIDKKKDFINPFNDDYNIDNTDLTDFQKDFLKNQKKNHNIYELLNVLKWKNGESLRDNWLSKENVNDNLKTAIKNMFKKEVIDEWFNNNKQTQTPNNTSNIEYNDNSKYEPLTFEEDGIQKHVSLNQEIQYEQDDIDIRNNNTQKYLTTFIGKTNIPSEIVNAIKNDDGEALKEIYNNFESKFNRETTGLNNNQLSSIKQLINTILTGKGFTDNTKIC